MTNKPYLLPEDFSQCFRAAEPPSVAIISDYADPSIIKEKIAVGGYGVVYKVIPLPLPGPAKSLGLLPTPVAYKSVKIKEKGIRFLMEVSIMCTYRHPSLVHALHVEVVESEGEYTKLRIYQELAKCDMRKYIEIGEYRSSEDKLRTHFLEVCSGIRFLHINKIIHGDIKSKNVLIYPVHGHDTVKLCDFDCSTIATNLKRENRVNCLERLNTMLRRS
jgi:serine/threonine protein kinase